MALGKKGETQQLRTLTLIGSSTVGAPTGEVGIVLDTLEAGPIALRVTLEICAGLRREIAAAETFLHQRGGVA